MNNILTYNDKSVTMKRKIIDYIVMSEYLIILEDFTGDDYNLVYCFDNELHKLWKIKKPDSKFIGQKQLPYVGITITKGPQCKIDPNHEGSDSKNHFKYTRTISTVVWIRDGNMLYYNKT